ncbi:MAG: hypothetical protein IT185_01180 [Acidobacteria bacterium]|nr:hypothetical protein [Acidobacteriota bacterium]
MIRLGLVALAAAWLSAGQTAVQPQELRVLFVGNSLTSMHNVPGLVEQLTSAGPLRVRSSSITRNDFSLDDHWAQGEAVRAIARGGWSHVVLQQGPSALPASRVQLRAAAKRFDEVIRKVGAQTALYMVWPSEARSGDFDAVRESYASAARDVGGVFLPAGEAWRAAWRRDPQLSLYASDRFHPTLQGSYAAALVIADRLTGRQPITEPKGLIGWTTLVEAARDVYDIGFAGGNDASRSTSGAGRRGPLYAGTSPNR